MTISSGNITSTGIVVQAYLNMTQNTTQGVVTQQKINVDCGKNTTACSNCINTAKKYKLGSGDYSDVCSVCFCTMENVNMNNYITLDLSAFTAANASQEFDTQLKNAVTQAATQNGTQLYNADDGLKALSESSNDLYSSMANDTFQNSLQELKNFQVMNMNDPNTSLINVDLDLTVNFLSNLLQENNSTSSILGTYDNIITQLTTEIVQGPMTVLVTWMVTLFVIAIVVAVFIFGIELVMDVFMLYAET